MRFELLVVVDLELLVVDPESDHVADGAGGTWNGARALRDTASQQRDNPPRQRQGAWSFPGRPSPGYGLAGRIDAATATNVVIARAASALRAEALRALCKPTGCPLSA